MKCSTNPVGRAGEIGTAKARLLGQDWEGLAPRNDRYDLGCPLGEGGDERSLSGLMRAGRTSVEPRPFFSCCVD